MGGILYGVCSKRISAEIPHFPQLALMAKKVSKPKQEKPQTRQGDPVPQEAWDNFDGLMGKALVKEAAAEKGKKKKAG